METIYYNKEDNIAKLLENLIIDKGYITHSNRLAIVIYCGIAGLNLLRISILYNIEQGYSVLQSIQRMIDNKSYDKEISIENPIINGFPLSFYSIRIQDNDKNIIVNMILNNPITNKR